MSTKKIIFLMVLIVAVATGVFFVARHINETRAYDPEQVAVEINDLVMYSGNERIEHLTVDGDRKSHLASNKLTAEIWIE